MNYKYDEETYAKLILENGFQSMFIRYELVVLVKYLKQQGYTKKNTEHFLYEFCKKYIEGFTQVKYYKVIDGAIRDGRKKNNKMIIIKNIHIMKCEIEYIDSLVVDHEYKKLLLSFLVKKKINMELCKINNQEAQLSTYFNGTRKTFKEVFDNANISGKYKINDMMFELVQKKIIKSIIKGNLILEYINKIKYKINKNVYYELTPKEFDKVGYVFDYYKGEHKVKKCDNCGVLIRSKGKKPTKYCRDCAKEIDRTKALERWETSVKNKKTSI